MTPLPDDGWTVDGPTSALLDALAGPRQVDASEWPSKVELPVNTLYVLDLARRLKADLERSVKAAHMLPSGRSSFLLQCLEPWRQRFRSMKRAERGAWRDFESSQHVNRAEVEDSENLRSQALEGYVRERGALAFQEAAFRSIVVADLITAGIRLALLALVAMGGFIIDEVLAGGLLVSFGLAVMLFVLLDQIIVDRLLEPQVESHRFRALVSACNESISACERFEANPHHLAAALDGVILAWPPSGSNGNDEASYRNGE